MWIFTNDAYVSIVQHRDDPDTLLVRGRFRGDAARFLGLPQHHEIELTTADYRWRVVTSRATVEKAMLRAVRRVSYPNFKDSIVRAWRKAVSMRVWSVMAQAQRERGGA